MEEDLWQNMMYVAAGAVITIFGMLAICGCTILQRKCNKLKATPDEKPQQDNRFLEEQRKQLGALQQSVAAFGQIKLALQKIEGKVENHTLLMKTLLQNIFNRINSSEIQAPAATSQKGVHSLADRRVYVNINNVLAGEFPGSQKKSTGSHSSTDANHSNYMPMGPFQEQNGPTLLDAVTVEAAPNNSTCCIIEM